ncbi:ATP-binding cassette sub-family G member 1 [Bombyx mandarina]|uniref:ABC transporter domain-containing protein n=2 Tax=Bombyx TaxID=7090 RepID=A0A8R2LZX7_BOMMO|nr:ATP-binding cassette sub-family G member 1 [Bombyx mandarina]XP_037870226.1 ATP-binding cassette sub-family G member 1 isoform X1 [Bombyx mori]XP_037870227.1 ATP-binding cassette sub-family G member 1 isoform X1 [Bombyx mori]
MTPGLAEDIGNGNNNVVPLLPRTTVELEFRNIKCTINTYSLIKFKMEQRQILKGVSGCFKPGALTAIMGPSGAGKTTLLNILAGYSTQGAKGEIAVNGACTCASQSSGRGGARYIRQHDDLRAYLTVYEAMSLAAALKLADFSRHERKEKVYEILALLGLSAAAETLCRDLSGGQKRRLAVALELLSDPSLMFLDEPTTGLDSSASASLITLLNNLARGGRTLIATIHQPSALIFEKIDNVYCLEAGRTLYNGPRAALVPALARAGLQCPSYHNPADFLMEVASGEYDVDLIKVAKKMSQFKTDDAVNGSWVEIPTIPALPSSLDISTEMKSKHFGESPKMRKLSKNIYKPSGQVRQTAILLYRNYLITTRNYALFMYRVAAHVVIALIFGYLYSGVGGEASSVLGNYVYLYGSMLLTVYTGKMSVTLSFPLEMEILKGEYFNRWYNLAPYIFSILAVELPFQMISCVSYVVLSYWLTDNPLEPTRATLFLATIVATSLCAQAWGYFIGSTTPTKIAVFIGPVLACLFSVFGFCLALSDTPRYFRWLHYISYFRAGFHVAVYSVYGFNRKKLQCSKLYCQFVTPKTFLKQMDMEEVDIGGNMTIVILTTVLMHLLTCAALWYRLNKR